MYFKSSDSYIIHDNEHSDELHLQGVTSEKYCSVSLKPILYNII